MSHRRADGFACLSLLCAFLALACDGENRSAPPAAAPPTADAAPSQDAGPAQPPDAGHELTAADLAKFDSVCAAAEDLWQQWLTGSCLTPQPKNVDNTWTAYADGHGHSYIYFEDSGPQCGRAHAALVARRYGVHPDALGECEAVLMQRLARCEPPELTACNMLYGAVSVGETCYREEILGVNPCPDNATCGSCPGTCQDCGGPCYDSCARCGLGKTCREYTIDMDVYGLTCGTGVNAQCGWANGAPDSSECDPGLECLTPENPTNEGDPNTCRVDPTAKDGDCAAAPLDCAPDTVCKDGKCQHVSVGESCVRHNQCESGYCASGQCAPSLAAGDVCPGPLDDIDVNTACQAPLACGGSADFKGDQSTCQPSSSVGPECHQTPNECGPGAFCSADNVCTALRRLGELCEQPSYDRPDRQCQDGLACTLLHDGSQRCVHRGTQEERPWCYPGGPTDK